MSQSQYRHRTEGRPVSLPSSNLPSGMLLGRLAAFGALAGRSAVSCRARMVQMGTSGVSSVTGMEPGPYPVGVTTMQFDDHSRKDPSSGGPRRLQTEIWYPAGAEAANLPPGRYSDYLGRGAIPGSIAAAEESDAIGGYRDGLTIAQLDAEWPGAAVRDARPDAPELSGAKWPLVLFSHGSGAFRASYIYWTEYLASHGFCVVACDHAGSARYTQLDGEVVKPGGARSTRAQMEADRPADLLFLLDKMGALAAGADSRFAGRLDATNCALTGMSFGGWTSAQALEACDPRVKAAILQCPSLAMSGGAAGQPPLATEQRSSRMVKKYPSAQQPTVRRRASLEASSPPACSGRPSAPEGRGAPPIAWLVPPRGCSGGAVAPAQHHRCRRLRPSDGYCQVQSRNADARHAGHGGHGHRRGGQRRRARVLRDAHRPKVGDAAPTPRLALPRTATPRSAPHRHAPAGGRPSPPHTLSAGTCSRSGGAGTSPSPRASCTTRTTVTASERATASRGRERSTRPSPSCSSTR